MQLVDKVFADRIQQLDGFEAYHALDCGRGQILSISLLRDQSAAEESDERALAFVREKARWLRHRAHRGGRGRGSRVPGDAGAVGSSTRLTGVPAATRRA